MGRERYLIRQPKTLESVALKKLGGWIVTYAKNIEPAMTALEQRYPTKTKELLSRQIEVIRNHIEHTLPGRFHNDAMIELKRSLSYRLDGKEISDILKTILKRMIETLFTKHVTSLTFEYSEWEDFEDSFYSKSHLIPRLTHLTLKRYCTDDVLRFLESNFKYIEELNIERSEINDKSMHLLSRLSNLRSVNLFDTEVTDRGIGTLLMSCLNIEYIAANKDIKRILEKFVNLENNYQRRFNLKYYFMTNSEPLAQTQLIVRMCPSIETLQLTLYKGEKENPNDFINTIQDLQNLRELKLQFCEFYTHGVKELLQVRGSNLVNLNFWINYEMDLDAIKHICLMCPNLQSLALDYNNGEKKDPRRNDEIPFKGVFVNLKKISLKSNSWGTMELENEIFILSICPNIEYIEIDLFERDIDGIMLGVLKKHPTKLKYLRELRTSNENLSKYVIDEIVQNCVQHPEIIYVPKPKLQRPQRPMHRV